MATPNEIELAAEALDYLLRRRQIRLRDLAGLLGEGTPGEDSTEIFMENAQNAARRLVRHGLADWSGDLLFPSEAAQAFNDLRNLPRSALEGGSDRDSLLRDI